MADSEKKYTLRMTNNVTKKAYEYEDMQFTVADSVFNFTIKFDGKNMPDEGEYIARIIDEEGKSIYNGLLQIGEVKRKGASRQYANGGVSFTQYNG